MNECIDCRKPIPSGDMCPQCTQALAEQIRRRKTANLRVPPLPGGGKPLASRNIDGREKRG
jgi:hypothetical protein